jgi:surface polysaccharide O-acyltransferase-like enzyme
MRLDWADNIRFIATVCVVILHTTATGMYIFNDISITDWWIANIFNSCTRFVIPFFFLLSGALNLNNNYSTPIFYKKRFLRVFLPFLFWGILFSTAFFVYYLVFNRPVSIFSLLKDFIYYQGVFRAQEYHLWFLYVLIGIYLLTPLIKLFTENLTRSKITIFSIFWIITLIINTFYIKNDIFIYLLRFTAYTGYYIAGYMLLKFDTSIRNKYFYFVFFVVIVAFMSITTYCLTKEDGVLNSPFNQTASITVFISAMVLYLLIINMKFENKTYKRLRDEINLYGLGIYIIHASVLSLIELSGLGWNFIHPLIGIPLTSIICIFVSYIIIRTMHKISWLKYVAG